MTIPPLSDQRQPLPLGVGEEGSHSAGHEKNTMAFIDESSFGGPELVRCAPVSLFGYEHGRLIGRTLVT